jgi:predicted permease
MYLSTLLPSIYVNYLIVGIPIFDAIWDPHDNVMIAVMSLSNDLVTLPAYLILSNIYCIRRANREHIAASDGLEEKFSPRIIGRILIDLITNPIVIGNAAGFSYAATRLPVFPFLADVLKYLGDAVLALSLFSVGGFLSQQSLIACGWPHFLTALGVRHFVMPFFVALLSAAFHISGKLTRQCILMSCCPSATASYLLTDRANVGTGVASTMIFWSTVFCVPCQLLWYFCLDKLGIFVEE